MRQCFCTPSASSRSSSSGGFDHIGYHQRGEAHFVDRDATAAPVQLWRRSRWFPDIDILQEGVTEIYFPHRERQELMMREENAPYLLDAISPARPRAFRIFTPAQLIESALVHGASCLSSDEVIARSWGRTLFDAFLYIGEARGEFHHSSIAKLYKNWLVDTTFRGGSAAYLRLVSRALADENAV